MQRLREMLAHGGMAVLAATFALAFATVFLASAISREVISIFVQSFYDEEFGDSPFAFTVEGTRIDLTLILQEAIVVALVGLALFGAWRLTRAGRRTCAQCLSEVPADAAICRYCTSEVGETVET
jgi:hypothetical protein